MGEFTTDCFAENRRIIPIIDQLYINNSVQFLGIPDFVGGSGLSFLPNLQDPAVPTGWRNGGTSNQNWVGRRFGPYIQISVSWGASIKPRPDYLPLNLINSCAAALRVRDNFLRHRRKKCLRRPSNWRNHIFNPRVHRRDDDREGPITK